MSGFLRKNLILFIVTLLSMAGLVALSHVTVLNFSREMEEQYDRAANDGMIRELETAIGYGKSLDNYYGLGELLQRGKAVLREGSVLMVLDTDGRMLASSEEGDAVELDTSLYGTLWEPISMPDGSPAGTCVTYYPLAPIRQDVLTELPWAVLLSAGCFLLILLGCAFAAVKLRREGRRLVPVIIAGVLLQGVLLGILYMPRFQKTAEHSIEGVALYLQGTLSSMLDKGVRLEEIGDLDEALMTMAGEYEWIDSITIENGGAVRQANRLLVPLTGENRDISIAFNISSGYIRKNVSEMFLSYLATIVIAVIVMMEALPLSEIFAFRRTEEFGRRCSGQYAALAKSLRVISFLNSTFCYICLSFSALQIKEWNVGFLGLSPGIAAALSISLCTLADAAGMLVMPLVRIPLKKLMLATAAVLIVANFSCFFTHSVGVILLMRFFAGLASAGHKQIANTMISRGYESAEERAANLAANNYGIIGGILCGMGLGSIIAGVFGYAATFFAAGVGSLLYLGLFASMIPWAIFRESAGEKEEGAGARIRATLRILVSPAVWRTILLVVTPQYLLLMVIIVLIPGRVQSAGMSGVVLTYANLLNGVFGLYLGGYAAKFLIKRFGSSRSLALIFIVSAVGMALMDLPVFPVAMLLLGAVLMGLADGIGTPLATELFLGSRAVQGADEAAFLMLYSMLGSVIMTVAPVLLEICEGSVVWLLGLSVFFALAGALLFRQGIAVSGREKA